MSIFGSLDELSFPDVVSMLERRAGRLRVWDLPNGKHYDFHLNKGVLQAFQVDGAWLEDIFDLREEVVYVMQATVGTFEFERCSPDALATGINKPMQQLLLSASSGVDEIERYRSHFADTRTRFRTMKTLDTWTDYDLQQFWEQAQQAFRRGASAEELAPALGLSFEEAQLRLYKLRTLGAIAPVQEFRQRAEQQRARQASRQQVSGQQASGRQGRQLEPATPQASAQPQPTRQPQPTPQHAAPPVTALTEEFADLVAWADELDQKSSRLAQQLERADAVASSTPAKSATPQGTAVSTPTASTAPAPPAPTPTPKTPETQPAASPQHSDRQETMIQRMIRALSFGKRS